MKKGQKKRIWTKEQKLEIIEKHLKEHVSVRALEKEYDADRSMICHWLRDYNKYGEKAFDVKINIKVILTRHYTQVSH